MTTEILSRQIRRRRRQLGLSLAEVARRADTSAATLSRYENGWTRFETYTLRKLATALDCELRIVFHPVKRRETRTGRPIAERLRRLFWDRTLSETDLTRHRDWVLIRVLEYGTLADVAALRGFMGKSAFTAAVGANMSRLSPRTRSLWRQVLEKEGVSCTRKSSRDTLWPF